MNTSNHRHTRLVLRRYEDGAIGLPPNGRCIPQTNSLMSRLGCSRQFWFGEVENIARTERIAMREGSAWHKIMEDMYLWWQHMDSKYEVDNLHSCVWCGGKGQINKLTGIVGDFMTPEMVITCPHCGGDGFGPLRRIVLEFAEAVEEGVLDAGPDDIAEFSEKMLRFGQGYITTYQGGPLQNLEVVGVEQSMARAVLNPKTRKPYRPRTVMERYRGEAGVGWTYASTSSLHDEGVETIVVDWPVYQVARLDAILRDRVTKVGWVDDHKLTNAPLKFLEGLGVMPQLPGYCWILEQHKARYGILRVAGFMFDIANRKMHKDPRELKWKPPVIADLRAQLKARGVPTKGLNKEEMMAALSMGVGHGGFSKSLSGLGSVPSWRYEAALDGAKIPHDEYQEVLQHLRENVDPDLFHRRWTTFGRTAQERYKREVFAKSKIVTTLRRAACRIKEKDELDYVFPRTPICTMPGGSCSFRGPCEEDNPVVRSQYDYTPSTLWLEEVAEETHADSLTGFGETELGW